MVRVRGILQEVAVDRFQLVGLCSLATAFLDPRVADAAGSAVAVFTIAVRDVTGVHQDSMPKFTELLNSVVASAGFRTVPQAEIHQLLIDESKKSYRPCFDEACQVELGKAAAAEKAVLSTWAKFGNECRLAVRLYDLKTELAEFTTTASADCTDDGLREAIDHVGLELRAQSQGGYAAFRLDLADGAAVKNPATDQTGYLRISAAAKDRPDLPIDVWINGASVGTIPSGGFFTKELPIGRYIVVLRPAGGLFAHARHEIDLGTSGVRIPGNGTVQLKPLYGTLEIVSNVRDATVLLDGQPRSIKNGRFREDVPPGTHLVVVEAPGFISSTDERIVVEPGSNKRLEVRLIRNAGGLVIRGVPDGAEVLLDEVLVGRIPLSLPTVDVGSRVVEVRAKGYRPSRRFIPIVLGRDHTEEVALEPKLARIRVEGFARVGGAPVSVEADLYVDGKLVGSTPWKGDVLAEIEHELVLRIGEEGTPPIPITVPEGEEHRAILEAPASWVGATANVKFDLIEGPWSARLGSEQLNVAKPNPVRPGRIPILLLLDGQAVGKRIVEIGPGQSETVVVKERPRTEAELQSDHRGWLIRRWLSLGVTGIAAVGSSCALIVSHRAEAARDSAYASLRIASSPDEISGFRNSVVTNEDARLDAQAVAIGGAVVGSALLVWTLLEWFALQPTRGDLIGENIEPIVSESAL